jgi:iron complex outermembrane receptor protein
MGAWRFQSVFGTRAKSVPTASWSTRFNDPRFETIDSRGWLDVTYQRPIGRTEVTVRGYYDHYRYAGVYPYDEEEGVVLADDGARADWFGSELTARQTVSGRHAITAGVEYRVNPRQQQLYIYGDSTLVDDRRSSSEAAGYVQDEITITPRWTAIAGARYDWWSHKGGTGRPRAGLIFRTDYDTAFKVLYGEAYRAPNLYELYYGTEIDGSVANRDLAPESLRTTEAVIEQYFRGRVRVAMSAFYTRIRGLIDQVTTDEGAVTHVNQESVRAGGVELEAEGRWPSGLLVRGSFTAQDADSLAADETLSNAPHRLGTLQVALPVWRRQVQLASETIYTSQRLNVALEPLAGYWLSSLTATYRPVGSRFSMGASVYNLFDTEYMHPVGAEFVQGAIAQDGRTAALRATIKF